MKRRILALVLSAVLVVFSAPAAFAADAADMTDIAGHWAEESIGWVVENELFKGVSETKFSPDTAMTRGMFVTVLGRFAGIEPDEYRDWYLPKMYKDVSEKAYYAPYINWATRHGITNGTEPGKFSPEEFVTREQMATLILRFATIYHYDLNPITDEIVGVFADMSTVSQYARSAVERMRQTGLINGIRQMDGTYVFSPRANATRAQCATIFYRVSQSLTPGQTKAVYPDSITLSRESMTLRRGETFSLNPVLGPETATVKTITYVSSDPGVAKVDAKGVVTAVSFGKADVYAYTANGLFAKCTVTCGTYIASQSDSYYTKCMSIFGEVVDDPRLVYKTKEEAAAHMVTIPITVWDFTDSSRTSKYSKTVKITVHENIADTVQALFRDIYALPAKYCFNSVGGYRFANKSEHTPGLAIDVNPNQNFYCDPAGNAIVGSHFDPENDPYSFEIDGEVQQIFSKYGFRRGIYWSSGYKDYMHFSLFGT